VILPDPALHVLQRPDGSGRIVTRSYDADGLFTDIYEADFPTVEAAWIAYRAGREIALNLQGA